MPNKKPFLSVVVICYNGEATLAAALESLTNQTYPKNQYEIIVVDDCSTDDSMAVAAGFPHVKYIRLEKNGGVASARNAGLKIARGMIYVAFDCDCKADHDLLSSLVRGYQDGKAVGVGSVLVEPEPIKRLATRYISICDTLFAPASGEGSHKRKLPHQRLITYIKVRISTPNRENKPKEVSELYGASGSFLRETLLAVGGWDESMSGIEDRDLSQRIQNAFPGKLFYLVPDAKIVHERGESIWRYLMRPVKRGPVNFEFHRRNQIAPPIFPFPVAYALVCLASVFIYPVATAALLILLPQILYFWWPIKSLQRRQSILLLFPYIQLLEEMMVIVGLTDGFIKSIQRRHNA